MILTIVLIVSYLFLILVSIGAIKTDGEIDDEEDEIAAGSFTRASRWMLLFFTPAFMTYLLNVFVFIGKIPSIIVSILIPAGFILGFTVFYVTEKRLRNRRRAAMNESE